MPSNNVQSGGSSDQDSRPDVLLPSRQHSTPAPLFRVWGGIRSSSEGRRQGGGGRKYNPCIPVLSKTYSCNLEKPPQLRYSLTTWRNRGKQESEQHFLNGPQSPGKVYYTVVYKTKYCTNNTIHDGLRPRNCQCFLFAD